MSDAPKRMWRESIAPSPMYPDGGSFYHEKPTRKPTRKPTVEYAGPDLVAAARAEARADALDQAARYLNAAPDDMPRYKIAAHIRALKE